MTVADQQLELVRSWSDDKAWCDRLRSDGEAVARLLPARLRPLHEAVVLRARAVEANALILSGSTAWGRRTEISDLDYHLIGGKIETASLAYELDLHVLSADKLEAEVLVGDDFVQWSLRFGRVLFDDGTVREALRLIVERRPWPDAAESAITRRARSTSPDASSKRATTTGLSCRSGPRCRWWRGRSCSPEPSFR